MAPGVITNSETVLNDTLGVITNGVGLISGVTNDVKTCPIDHLALAKVDNGNITKSKESEDVDVKIQIHKLDKKQPRRVIRPKVLKNHESRVYLYDRLYDTTCPRVVSLIICLKNKKFKI